MLFCIYLMFRYGIYENSFFYSYHTSTLRVIWEVIERDLVIAIYVCYIVGAFSWAMISL